MKIVGLITEYNPFHNGHQYHIQKAREITGADYCIAVMSGDFVQRGAPAFLPKHLRTSMALNGGCDMVIELPVCYATGSAEYFASGAVSILDNLNCVDAICFGSECGDYSSLEKIAKVLVDEPEEFKIYLQTNLKSGMNFPSARQKALESYFQDDELNAIINEPNNILGIEYIKALLLRNSKIKGYTITREGASYHDDKLNVQYSSASAIRKVFQCKDVIQQFDDLKDSLNKFSLDILKSQYNVRYPVVSDDFSLLFRYKLLSESVDSLSSYMDITSELAHRIINHRNKFVSISQFTEVLKTKELTYSRISRCLMHILLDIKKCSPIANTYARLLGFRTDSSEIFSYIKRNSKIPLITKLTNLESLESEQQEILQRDVFAADLYESILSDKFQQPFINELQQQIIKH